MDFAISFNEEQMDLASIIAVEAICKRYECVKHDVHQILTLTRKNISIDNSSCHAQCYTDLSLRLSR